ncbi:hypothetical protein JCM11491_000076 [Sporobolomyces phaffii]
MEVDPFAATLTVRAAPSVTTPVAALALPFIAPFEAVAAFFVPEASSAPSATLSTSLAPVPTSSAPYASTSSPASVSDVTHTSSTSSSLSASTSDSGIEALPSSTLVALSVINTTDPVQPAEVSATASIPQPLPSSAAQNVGRSVLDSRSELVADDLFKRGTQPFAARRKAILLQRACVRTGANETTINSLLYYGGRGAIVKLCPRAVIEIRNPIFFFAPDQVLTTAGDPTGSNRATIVVTGATQSCAIYGAVPNADNVILRNIQVNGNRPQLGILWGGLGLLEFGGNTVGQKIQNVHAYEPRGWSALHAAEGGRGADACSGMEIKGNQIGPSGHGPSGVNQFRRRDTGTWSPGQWADGISHACQNSVVRDNVVTDATDGAIVIFGAPGSTITGNTIIADQRVALGGINAVDFMPYGGSFEGTVVKNNRLIAQNSMIKVGIAIGGMVWGVDNRTASRTFGGSFIDNEFSSGANGYFGYGIGISGHNGAVVTGNKVTGEANFGGVPSPSCFSWLPHPAPQPFIADPTNTPGSTLQDDFWVKTVLVLLICKGPGAILNHTNFAALCPDLTIKQFCADPTLADVCCGICPNAGISGLGGHVSLAFSSLSSITAITLSPASAPTALTTSLIQANAYALVLLGYLLTNTAELDFFHAAYALLLAFSALIPLTAIAASPPWAVTGQKSPQERSREAESVVLIALRGIDAGDSDSDPDGKGLIEKSRRRLRQRQRSLRRVLRDDPDLLIDALDEVEGHGFCGIAGSHWMLYLGVSGSVLLWGYALTTGVLGGANNSTRVSLAQANCTEGLGDTASLMILTNVGFMILTVRSESCQIISFGRQSLLQYSGSPRLVFLASFTVWATWMLASFALYFRAGNANLLASLEFSWTFGTTFSALSKFPIPVLLVVLLSG